MSEASFEAARQSALLAAVRGAEPGAELHASERGERRHQALAAYRANAAGLAERALATACPTVQALLGEEDFAALARALWAASPPQRGDLAQWGWDLPEFIAAERDLDPWPYLADCARLDLAVQRCEAAADATLDRDSLALLAEHPPEALRLRLRPCVQLLASDWPIARIRAAHQLEGEAAQAAFADAREAIARREPEAVVVARADWRGLAGCVSATDFAWMSALHAGARLDHALQHAGGDFDFDAWLVRALQQGWLCKAEPIATDNDEEHHHDTQLA